MAVTPATVNHLNEVPGGSSLEYLIGQYNLLLSAFAEHTHGGVTTGAGDTDAPDITGSTPNLINLVV